MFPVALLTALSAQAADTKLWYDKPAGDNWMTEALPVGNGDLLFQFGHDKGQDYQRELDRERMVNCRIASPEPRRVRVCVNGETKTIKSEKQTKE